MEEEGYTGQQESEEQQYQSRLKKKIKYRNIRPIHRQNFARVLINHSYGALGGNVIETRGWTENSVRKKRWCNEDIFGGKLRSRT